MPLFNDQYLYALRRGGDQVVLVTVRNVEEAQKYFEAVGAPPPAPPQMEERHLERGEENEHGI